MIPVLRSVGEVAEILGTNERYVRERINSGKLQCYRDGRRTQVSDDQIAAYLASTATRAPPPAFLGRPAGPRRRVKK